MKILDCHIYLQTSPKCFVLLVLKSNKLMERQAHIVPCDANFLFTTGATMGKP